MTRQFYKLDWDSRTMDKKQKIQQNYKISLQLLIIN